MEKTKFWRIILTLGTLLIGSPAFSNEDLKSLQDLTKCYYGLAISTGLVEHGHVGRAGIVREISKKSIIVEGTHPTDKKARGVYLYQEDGLVSFYSYPKKYASIKSRESQPFILCDVGKSCEESSAGKEPVFVVYGSDEEFYASSVDGLQKVQKQVEKDRKLDFERTGRNDPQYGPINWLNPKSKALIPLTGGEVLDLSTTKRKEAMLAPLRKALRNLFKDKEFVKKHIKLEIDSHGDELFTDPMTQTEKPYRKVLEEQIDFCLAATDDRKIKAELSSYKTMVASTVQGEKEDASEGANVQ